MGTFEVSDINWPVEFSDDLREVILKIRSERFTQVSFERLFATAMACTHVVESGLDGDFVECGVWKGGNAILASWIFEKLGSNKKVYLYDTFAGMTEPTDVDRVAATGASVKTWYETGLAEDHNTRNYVPIDEVKRNFDYFGVSKDRAVFVKGDVAKTLKANDPAPPEKISVLRLDTDWYESTKVELEVLYPRLVPGGVLMIDDYGHFEGAKVATDEYFQAGGRPLLQYIDYTGRVGVKC